MFVASIGFHVSAEEVERDSSCRQLAQELKTLVHTSPDLLADDRCSIPIASAYTALGEQKLVVPILASAEEENAETLLFAVLATVILSETDISTTSILKLVDSSRVRDRALGRAAVFLADKECYEAAVAMADAVSEKKVQENVFYAVAIRAVKDNLTEVATTALRKAGVGDLKRELKEIEDNIYRSGWETQLKGISTKWKQLLLRELRSFSASAPAPPIDMQDIGEYLKNNDEDPRNSAARCIAWGLLASKNKNVVETRRAVEHIKKFQHDAPSVFCDALPILAYFYSITEDTSGIVDLAFRQNAFRETTGCERHRTSPVTIASIVLLGKLDRAVSLINDQSFSKSPFAIKAFTEFALAYHPIEDFLYATRKFSRIEDRCDALAQAILQCKADKFTTKND